MAIIVGDIHGDIEKARAFLAYKPETEHVALGDYLDSYVEPIERQRACLQLLMDSGAVLLLGNHECHYLKHPLFQFPGYQVDHANILQDILESNLDRFNAAYAADGWLCTHAGVNSNLTERQNDVTVLADTFNDSWELYLKNRLVDHQARYLYQSIFQFNHCIFVEGNLLPTNITQIFGHMEHRRPILESNYIALDTTNFSNSCWLYDTEYCELVQLPLEPKIGRVRFRGGASD
ncbi:MAG: metallophosphoesterase [Geobacteraceae bacterium]